MLVHRGPVVTAIDTFFGSSMRVRHACDSLRHTKYEARLSAGFTGGPRWLGLVFSLRGLNRDHPSGDNKHDVLGKVATSKKKGVVPYVGATFQLVVRAPPSGEVRIHEWTSTTVVWMCLLDARWERYSVSVLFLSWKSSFAEDNWDRVKRVS